MNKAQLKSKILDFFSKEQKKLIGYVRRLIDDAADRDSEDIVQEVILGIFDRADITIPIENVAAYVYQALRNKVIDYLRKRRDTVSLDAGWQDNEEGSLLDVLPAVSIIESDEISRMEARETLFKALSLLNSDERAVLIATDLEGKTFQDISDESGEPLGTLLARKSRAIKKLKESFYEND